MLFKMDSPILNWVRQQPTFNTIDGDFASGIAVDSRGNTYIAYYTTGTASGQINTGETDIVIYKLNTDGEIQWIIQQPIFNTILVDNVPSIGIDLKSNIYVAYSTNGTVSGQTNIGMYDIAVLKLSKDGVIQWTTQQPTFNTTDQDENTNIAVDRKGNCYITYSTNGSVSGQINSGSYDIVVFKLNTDGIFQWVIQQPTFNTPDLDFASTIAVDKDGNSYVSFTTQGTVTGQVKTGIKDIVVFKINKEGVLQWVTQQPTFNTTQFNDVCSIAVQNNGNCYVAFASNGTASGQINTGNYDIIVFKLNSDGIFQWIKQQPTFNTSNFDYLPDISVDNAGNTYISYSTLGTVSGQINSGSLDIVVFKLNTNGVFQWVTQQPTFNTTSSDNRPNIAVDKNGNIYVVYTTLGTASGQTNTGSYDNVVFKLSQINPAPPKKCTSSSYKEVPWNLFSKKDRYILPCYFFNKLV